MNSFKKIVSNFSIRNRLFLGLLLVLLVGVSINGIQQWRFDSSLHEYAATVQSGSPEITKTISLIRHVGNSQKAVLIGEKQQDFLTHCAEIQLELSELEMCLDSDATNSSHQKLKKGLFLVFTQKFEGFQETGISAIRYRLEQKEFQKELISRTFLRICHEFTTRLAEYQDVVLQEYAEKYTHTQTISERAGMLSWFYLLACFVVAILVGLLISDTILKPISSLKLSVNQQMENDAFTKVQVSGQDELGVLANAFNAMVQRLDESFRTIKEKNDQLAQNNATLEQMNTEMSQMNIQLSDSLIGVHSVNENITDSINHASKLQKAILPDVKVLDKYFENFFVILRAQQIVSGDFYWFHEKNENEILVAVADCTGHGVPGAMTGMAAIGLLGQAIGQLETKSPAALLGFCKAWFEKRMDYDIQGVPDGMDISLLSWDKTTRRVKFAGAQQKIYMVHENEIRVFDGNHFPIDGLVHRNQTRFDEVEFEAPAGASIYLLSDGWQDQFGVSGKKYGRKRMRQTMLQAQNLTAVEREDFISKKLREWQGYEDQTDDVLVCGLFV